MSGTDNVESIDIGLADETIDVSVDKGEAGASSLVAEKTGLDVVRGNIPLNQGVVLEEDHRYRLAFRLTLREMRKEETHRPQCSRLRDGIA